MAMTTTTTIIFTFYQCNKNSVPFCTFIYWWQSTPFRTHLKRSQNVAFPFVWHVHDFFNSFLYMCVCALRWLQIIFIWISIPFSFCYLFCLTRDRNISFISDIHLLCVWVERKCVLCVQYTIQKRQSTEWEYVFVYLGRNPKR